MKFWTKRKTDEEYVEQVRKNYFGRWQLFARIFCIVNGLILYGMFIWLMTMLPILAPSLLEIDVDLNPLLGSTIFIGFMFGVFAGITCFIGTSFIFQGIFWSGTSDRTTRLMFKYHDALVARGISPDEQADST